MPTKQTLKPIAESVEDILLPYLSYREKARSAQTWNQEVMLVLESDSPPQTENKFRVSSYMRKTEGELLRLCVEVVEGKYEGEWEEEKPK